MYFEVSGCQNISLTGCEISEKSRRDMHCGIRDTGKNICAEYSTEQNVLISTKKCEINLIFTGGMRDAG